MTNQRPAGLVTEAERYLAAVAVFRSEGCELHWRPESSVQPNRLLHVPRPAGQPEVNDVRTT
jgi:hypothetical protein